jgi:hypothetical protein
MGLTFFFFEKLGLQLYLLDNRRYHSTRSQVIVNHKENMVLLNVALWKPLLKQLRVMIQTTISGAIHGE